MEPVEEPAADFRRLVAALSSRTDATAVIEEFVRFCATSSTLRSSFVQALQLAPDILRDAATAPLAAAADVVHEEPPTATGRRVESSERFDDRWLRSEWVPCGNARCKKEPDLHGPYWYSYTWTNDRWRTKYHGRKRPDFGPSRSLGEVRETLALLSAKPDLTEAEVTKLCNQVADLAHLDGAEVSELRREAALLVARHEERRELEIVERHRSLSARALVGEQLTSKERDELAHLSGLLASDH